MSFRMRQPPQPLPWRKPVTCALDILGDRLERLLEYYVIVQIPAADGTNRLAYRLTDKGPALRPVLKALRDWGLAWDKSTRDERSPVSAAPRQRHSPMHPQKIS